MRTILLLLIILISLPEQLYCQASTASPYSMFGLGKIDSKGSGRAMALGGTGIALKSDGYLNNINPASFSSIDTQNFIFEIGLQSSIIHYNSYDVEQRFTTTNFNNLAMGFGITKWWKSSIGLKPFSHVGYNISVENPIEGSSETYTTVFKGEGDISQFYWGNAFRLFKGLSLGVNASYLFGPIERKEHVYLPYLKNEAVIINKNHINNLYIDYGVQYTIPINKWNYTLGMIYGNKRTLKSTNSKLFYNGFDDEITENKIGKTSFDIPQKIGFGYSMVDKTNNLKLAFDYKLERWSEVEFEKISARFKNSQRFSLGLSYLPMKSSRDAYYKRIQYILGGYYTKSNLEYKGTQLNEKAFSVGMVLPINKNGSFINVGFEMGEAGSLKNGLIKEKFYNFNLSFTLKNNWFVKREFN